MKTIATIRSSVSISTRPNTSVRNAPGPWSLREKWVRMRTRRSPRVAMMVDETFVIQRSTIVRMSAICASRPCWIPAPTTPRRSSLQKSSASSSAMASQSCALKHRKVVLSLGLPRSPAVYRSAEFVEPRDRGVEVCLVEYLAAIDQFAVNRENRDPTPLGVKTLLRRLICCVCDDCSGVGQPMHGLDIEPCGLGPGPARRRYIRSGRRPPSRLPAVVDVDHIRRRQRHLVSVDRRIAARITDHVRA